MSESRSNFPARHGTPWNTEELQRLLVSIAEGVSLKKLTQTHQRSSGGIRGAIKRLLPSEFLEFNDINTVNDLSNYFNKIPRQEHNSIINNLISLSTAKTIAHDKVEIQKNSFKQNTPLPLCQPNTDFKDYIADEHDVIMLIHSAIESLSNKRHQYILLMRLGTDDSPHSLADIAVKLGISRERVRQLQERALGLLAAKSRYEGTPGACLKALINSIGNSPYDIAVWIYRIVHRDFVTSSELAAKFIIFTAGIPKARRNEIKNSLSLISQLQKQRLRERRAELAHARAQERARIKKERVEFIFSKWLDNTHWPKYIAPPPPVEQLCSQRAVNDTDISGFFYSQKLGRTVQYESGLEFKIMNLLECCDQVLFYQEQPFSIPYCFKNKSKKYYPDLLIATVDGRCLLMEVKPTDRMTLSLTRIKSNAGRKWAHTRGWGWLVISDRFSLRQLEEHAISTNTWKLIEAELKTSRILAWREMMELRTRYEIHRLDLIAYIIQSGAEVDNFYRITPKISNNTSNQRQPNESDCHN
ncbi:TnsA endonuclease N-terminal domain-containing protein [Escherichia coli]|uniref:TnsA endonuclease N-terminal domain-containing protein n=1 Tax=Escherichia coli TaxID=562 RepID=UPI001CD6C168|nr:TnsA endonuclease N-terminal domain-containing protein [Escherichia coli]